MGKATYAFQDPGRSFEERARDLVCQMTLGEKIAQMLHYAPAIERLGVPAYNWWNECLHGVGRAGIATVFPQAIGLASTFDTDLMGRVATVISDEARAKHHANAKMGDRGIYKGLTYWTPNINIFRDPRWGRGQETYGECPYLTGRMAVAFVKALQGDDPKYLKLVATPKHLAVHSGPEEKRHAFNAEVSMRDLWETYLPAFRDSIIEAKAESVMGAYNRTNGEPCCGSKLLIDDILRGRWKFQGYVVSDCWAIQDFFKFHGAAKTEAESAALAVKRGCDLNCGSAYEKLMDACEKGLVSEADIDVCLYRLMLARMRLGMFDPEEMVPYASIPYEVVDSPGHRALALEAARASIVLLKNEAALLPLSRELGSIAVIGPNADSVKMMLGNYNGIPSKAVAPLDGIRAKVSAKTRVLFQPGSEHIGRDDVAQGEAKKYFAEAELAARTADVSILVLGLTAELEGEQGDASNADASGDRVRLGLPRIQQLLLERIVAVGKPVILVIESGSAVSVPWAQEHVGAIVQQFYPGEEGGTALADVLFGDYSPAGRMPVTVYQSEEQLADFEDYAMDAGLGRTYRFFKADPLYPFGFGLGYTKIAYTELIAPAELQAGYSMEVEVTLRNDGKVAGEEVVQVYIEHLDPAVRAPVRQLAGFTRIRLAPGETRSVSLQIDPRQMALFDDDGMPFVAPGKLRLHAGGSQPDPVSRALGAAATHSHDLAIVGERVNLGF